MPRAHIAQINSVDQRLVCPTCHRPTQSFRLGIHWPPIKAAILDVIVARGELGASTQEIILSEVYEGRRRPRPTCIKSHVQQINDLLETESDGWRIVRDDGRWVLRRARGRK
jgi:hypothetical protein